MFGVGVYDQMKRAFQDLIAPEIHALRGDIRVINEKITALEEKIDGVDASLTAKIDSVDARLSAKIDGVDARPTARIDGVETRLVERIGGIESRLAEKIDHVETRLVEKITDVDIRLNIKIDSLRAEMMSMKGEMISEIRRLDTRIDGVDRELHAAIDVRERLAALEARRSA